MKNNIISGLMAMPSPRKSGQPRVGNVLLPRNNLVALDSSQRFLFQPEYFNLHTRGAHNIKMAIGYVGDRLVFSHGSDSDLLHRADQPRVVVLIPRSTPFRS